MANHYTCIRQQESYFLESIQEKCWLCTQYIRNSSSGEYCWLGEQVLERIKITCHACRVKEDLFWHSNLQIKKTVLSYQTGILNFIQVCKVKSPVRLHHRTVGRMTVHEESEVEIALSESDWFWEILFLCVILFQAVTVYSLPFYVVLCFCPQFYVLCINLLIILPPAENAQLVCRRGVC
jgi:hypothetical protein